MQRGSLKENSRHDPRVYGSDINRTLAGAFPPRNFTCRYHEGAFEVSTAACREINE